MRVAANLSMMFTNVDLVARYEKAARLGFKLVEVPFPYSVPAEQLRAEADKFGLQHVLINAPP
ncbi:Protein C05D11.5, partial [Aphelenchoides avenae]